MLLHDGQLFAARCTIGNEDAGAGDVFRLGTAGWETVGGRVHSNCDNALGVDRNGNLLVGVEPPQGGLMAWKIDSATTWAGAGDGLPSNLRSRGVIANSKNDLLTIDGAGNMIVLCEDGVYRSKH